VRARGHRAGAAVCAVQGSERSARTGGSSSCEVQIPWSVEDHREQEVGIHEVREGRLCEVEGRKPSGE
jgi:hypothetical protein